MREEEDIITHSYAESSSAARRMRAMTRVLMRSIHGSNMIFFGGGGGGRDDNVSSPHTERILPSKERKGFGMDMES